jgi:hypothetical protein
MTEGPITARSRSARSGPWLVFGGPMGYHDLEIGMLLQRLGAM